MRFTFQVLAAVALISRGAFALTDTVMSSVNGQPDGGASFSDLNAVTPGQMTKFVHIRAGERVKGVGVDILDAHGLNTKLYHGDGGGDRYDLELADDEYITAMEAHGGEKEGKVRIVFIRFATNKGRTVEGGTRTNKVAKVKAREGYQLSGFHGSSGKELDSVGVI